MRRARDKAFMGSLASKPEKAEHGIFALATKGFQRGAVIDGREASGDRRETKNLRSDN